MLLFLQDNGCLLEEYLTSKEINNLTLIVTDPTKLFLSKGIFEKYTNKGGVIKVINKINIIMITINPTSPLGYEFDKLKFLNELKKGLTIPIYDLGPSEY